MIEITSTPGRGELTSGELMLLSFRDHLMKCAVLVEKSHKDTKVVALAGFGGPGLDGQPEQKELPQYEILATGEHEDEGHAWFLASVDAISRMETSFLEKRFALFERLSPESECVGNFDTGKKVWQVRWSFSFVDYTDMPA